MTKPEDEDACTPETYVTFVADFLPVGRMGGVIYTPFY